MSIDDLAIQPGTNTLYAVRSNTDNDGAGGFLYTVNKTSGVATFVGNTGGAGRRNCLRSGRHPLSDGLQQQPGLRLAQQAHPTNAARISTVTLSSYYDGLGIRPTDGTLFATLSGTGTNMYTINPSTGAATLVGGTGGGSASDVAFGPYSTLAPTLQSSDPSGTILGSTSAGAGRRPLRTVSTTTGGTYTVTVGGGANASAPTQSRSTSTLPWTPPTWASAPTRLWPCAER